MRPRLQILVSSVRQRRRGGAIGTWVHERATAHGAFDVELIDLAQLGLPLMDEPEHPRLGRYTHEHTRRWSGTVASADAFVFVTPEYNHGFSAPLKNAIDYLHAEWAHKPVAFVSYGGASGGMRAVQMLKQVVIAVRMLPIYEGVAIPFAARRMSDGGERFEDDEQLRGAATAMLDALARIQARMSPA